MLHSCATENPGDKRTISESESLSKLNVSMPVTMLLRGLRCAARASIYQMWVIDVAPLNYFSVLSQCIAQHDLRAFLRNHHCAGIGVTTRNRGHNGGIYHSQSVNTMNF